MRAARLAVVAVFLAGAGVFVWYLMRGDQCRKFADKVCAISPASCSDAKLALEGGGVSADRCREGNDVLDGIDKHPPALRSALAAAAFAEAIGAEEMYRVAHDAMMLLLDIDFDVEQGRSPDQRIKMLRALGPSACGPLITRLNADDPKRKDLAHQLLVELRGQDLGTDASAWQPWCRDVFKAGLKQK